MIYAALDDTAQLLLGDTVQSLVDDGDRVRVAFQSGRVGDFDLVVGADGLHSRVRSLIFGPEQSFERYLGIVVAAFEARGYRPRDELIAMMHADVGFQAVRLSLRDDATLVLFTVRHHGAVPTDDQGAQQALLRTRLAGKGWEVPAMLDLMSQAKTFYFDSVSQICMPSWTRGRVALVGDAAACPSLLAGHGSALAMVQSYTLAAELARASDHREAFARYEQRLAPLLRSKQQAATRLAASFAPTSRRQLLLRNTVMKLMGLPWVTNLVMGRSSMMPSSSSRSPGGQHLHPNHRRSRTAVLLDQRLPNRAVEALRGMADATGSGWFAYAPGDPKTWDRLPAEQGRVLECLGDQPAERPPACEVHVLLRSLQAGDAELRFGPTHGGHTSADIIRAAICELEAVLALLSE